MDDDFAFLFTILFLATIAFAIYQRVFVIRRLRKKLAEHVNAAAAPASVPPPSPVASEDLGKMEQRLRVLERIAVEKENTLAREIEDLRAAKA